MIKKIYNHFMGDSLYRNSIYLMASTFIMAFFGFFFWMINARLFTTEQVGLGTTLISVISLITGFSLLGLNMGIIRYLPTSKRKNDKINTVFTITALTTIIVSTIFLLGLKVFSPKLMFIKENLYYSLFFIAAMVFMTLFLLIESVFIAFRNTKYVLIKNTIFSVLKLVFPFLLVTFGAMGIFGSWTISAIIGFAVVFIILIVKFNYKPQPVFSDNIIKKIGRFSFGNYIAGFFGGLPIMILPLMITNMINPETTAYYYITMMIAGLLFIIPGAISQSLFAEGSYNEKELKKLIKKSAKIIFLILIPAILVVIFFGKYLLLLFGKEYSVEGFRLLQLLALSGIFTSVNYICGTILQVKKRIKTLIFMCFLGALLILGLSYLFISKGLLGIGLAWIIGQGVVSGVYFGLKKVI